MKTKRYAAASLQAGVCLLVILPGLHICAQTQTWYQDRLNSAAQFSVSHMGISTVPGTFTKVNGLVEHVAPLHAVPAKTKAVNGSCGSSSGEVLSGAPSSGLCTAGTASAVLGVGPWKWTCTGSSGGSTASCAALASPSTVSPCSTGTTVAVSSLSTPTAMGGNKDIVPCFINSLGVNNHMNWTGYVYDNPTLVNSEMNYLGINHIRDMLYSDISSFDKVAEAGNVFDTGFFNTDEDVATELPSFLTTLNQFVTSYPGSVVSFEGPNELNCQEALYNGVSTITSAAAAVGAQLDIYTSMKADSTLAAVPVMNSSLSLSCTSLGSAIDYIAAEGNMDAEVNLANVHIYSVTNPPLSTFLSSTLGMPVAQLNAPGKPVAITEFGFSTPAWVSTAVAARYTIFGLADAYKEGAASLYIYELMDGDTGDGYVEDNFGLFQTNGTAKPAGTAIHNMTTILNATDDGQTNFTAPSTPTISNLPSGAASLMLVTGMGGFDLLVWDETASLGSLSVSLGATYPYVYVYDPVESASPIQSFTNVSTITLKSSSDLLIVAAVP